MSSGTSIEWTDVTWNPVRGCSHVSEGCRHCYAERMAARFSDEGLWGHGFAERMSPHGGLEGAMKPWVPRWTGRVELVPEKLAEPLSWRKPSRVFVNSTSDLFHEKLPDEAIDRVFAVMALADRHTFQVLTKRPERMLEWMTGPDLYGRIRRRALEPKLSRLAHEQAERFERDEVDWPLPNVWLGVSVEDQKSADERIQLLLQTPAAVRFLSCEPLLERIDIVKWFRAVSIDEPRPGMQIVGAAPRVDWVIVGGESGPDARPCDVGWLSEIVEDCRNAKTPCFVKQLGARPIQNPTPLAAPQSPESLVRDGEYDQDPLEFQLSDAKGGDPLEWPEELRVREFPA